jgi:hypothetical protein
MAERIELPQPVIKTKTKWEVGRVSIDFVLDAVRVILVADDGDAMDIDYPTPPPFGRNQPAGRAVIADLLNPSPGGGTLKRRLLSRAIQDGYAQGTIQGA